ncbi:MAG: tetratricopeptide repeat protein [Candidatus Omnitrophota bacterium]
MAEKAFEDGLYDASLSFLERFQKDYPGSANAVEADLLAGQCFFHQNKFARALDKFEGLMKNPRAGNIRDTLYYWIAEVNLKKNDYEKAATYYREIIRGYPASAYLPAAYYSLGWCLFQGQRFKEALGYFEALVEKYPREPQAGDAEFKIIEALYGLKDYAALKQKIGPAVKAFSGDALRKAYLDFYAAEADYYLGDYKGALAGYSKVLADPAGGELIRVQSLVGKADSLYNLGDYAGASGIYQEALVRTELKELTGPALDKLYYNLGWSLLKQEDAAGAVEAFRKIPDPDSDDIGYSLGLAYFNKGDYARARSILGKFQTGFEGSELRPKALFLLGNCCYILEDYARAMQAFKEAARSASSDAELAQKAEYAAADSLFQLGREEEALAGFKALRAKYSDGAIAGDIIWWLGNYYYRNHDRELAARYFLSFIQDFPRNPLSADAHYFLGLTFMETQKTQEALDNFREALKADRDDLKPKVLLRMAEIEEGRGNIGAAIKNYAQAVGSAGKDRSLAAVALLRMGRIYEDENDAEEAFKAYTRILGMNVPESKYAEERLANLKRK